MLNVKRNAIKERKWLNMRSWLKMALWENEELVLEALAVLLTPKRYGSKAKERIAKDIDKCLKKHSH